jgi:hypothetical protein
MLYTFYAVLSSSAALMALMGGIFAGASASMSTDSRSMIMNMAWGQIALTIIFYIAGAAMRMKGSEPVWLSHVLMLSGIPLLILYIVLVMLYWPSNTPG